MLGEFINCDVTFTPAVELKTPGADLDLPQPRHGNETAVQQGFFYGRNILAIRWVIVSDMKVLRLYSVESQGEYEEVVLSQCVEENGAPTDEIRRLHFLVHHSYLIAGHLKSQVASLYYDMGRSPLGHGAWLR